MFVTCVRVCVILHTVGAPRNLSPVSVVVNVPVRGHLAVCWRGVLGLSFDGVHQSGASLNSIILYVSCSRNGSDVPRRRSLDSLGDFIVAQNVGDDG